MEAVNIDETCVIHVGDTIPSRKAGISLEPSGGEHDPGQAGLPSVR